MSEFRKVLYSRDFNFAIFLQLRNLGLGTTVPKIIKILIFKPYFNESKKYCIVRNVQFRVFINVFVQVCIYTVHSLSRVLYNYCPSCLTNWAPLHYATKAGEKFWIWNCSFRKLTPMFSKSNSLYYIYLERLCSLLVRFDLLLLSFFDTTYKVNKWSVWGSTA